ncbi:hypothetical protein ACHAW6_013579 [Cyclotella cf. meneghiniana]
MNVPLRGPLLLLLALLVATTHAAVQIRVLRGQRSLHADHPTRLFRKGPKDKKSDDDIASKKSAKGGSDNLGVGSSGSVDWSSGSVDWTSGIANSNAAKCKAKVVKVPVSGSAAGVAAAAGSTSTSSTVTASRATEGTTAARQPRGKFNEPAETSDARFEIVRQEICDENGNLIPPNTYWPTVSPAVDDDDGTDIIDTNGNDVLDLVHTDAPTASPPTAAVSDDGDIDDNGPVPTSSPVESGLAFQSDDIDVDDDTSRTSSPGCNAFESNQVYLTSLSARVSFLYEISVHSTYNVSAIIQQLDNNSARLVGSELIHCELMRRERAQRRLESNVDGIDPLPIDAATGAACTYFSSNESGTSCHAIQGRMTLYLRQNAPSSSALQSSSQALKILMQYFNMQNSPFLADSDNDEYRVDGLIGIRYISGTPDEQIYIDNNGNGGTLNAGGASQEVKNESQEVKNLSVLGVAMVTVGSVLLLSLLVVTAMRNKRDGNSQETYAEFNDDENDLNKDWDRNEDDDVSHEGTLESISSAGSPKAEPLATLYQDEDSIYTDYRSSSIVRALHASEAAAASHCIGDDRSLSSKRPVFLSAYDETSTAGESIEHVYDPNRSIYTQNSQLSRPTFENPSELGRNMENRRKYTVDNTVEF